METWTIRRLTKWTKRLFNRFNLDKRTRLIEADLLVAHVLNVDRAYIYAHPLQELTELQVMTCRQLAQKRITHIPMAYIVGHRAFMNIDLNVSKDVLIPRPETEILVEETIERLKNFSGEIKVADIGTGSGAIAISISTALKNVTVEAVDISNMAIEVARYNAEKYEVTKRLNFHVGDLLTPLEGQKFHAIVSNPPYIPTKVIETLEPEVAAYEPKLALDGGEDGLNFYRRLSKGAPDLLVDGGFLAVEIGIDQTEAVMQLMQEANLVDIEVIKDFAGIDRIIIAWKNNGNQTDRS